MTISPLRNFLLSPRRRLPQPGNVMAGYSATPLIRKIGIKPGHRIHLHNNPGTFLRDLGQLPEEVKLQDRLVADTDVMVCFVESEADLRKQFSRLAVNWQPTECYGLRGPNELRAG